MKNKVAITEKSDVIVTNKVTIVRNKVMIIKNKVAIMKNDHNCEI